MSEQENTLPPEHRDEESTAIAPLAGPASGFIKEADAVRSAGTAANSGAPSTAMRGPAVADAVHSLDAVPGGKTLTNDRFHEGRLHMLQREEAIYLSSRMLREAHRQEASSGGNRQKSEPEIAGECALLLQRQNDEAELFRSLLDACSLMSSPTGPGPASSLGAPQVIQAEGQTSGCLSPDELEPYLAAYTDFVFLGGSLRKDTGGLFGSGASPVGVARRHYGPPEGEALSTEEPEGDPAWIHVNVPGKDPLAPHEPMFPYRLAREGRLSRRAKASAGKAKNKNGKAQPRGQGFVRFLVRLLRLLVLGLLIGVGYLMLTRYGQG